MADQQIQLPNVGALPKEWTVPGALSILLKCVQADFDGSGAAGAFLPTVEIVSDAGLLVGRSFTDASVAAGGSASVTFAPFLEGAASSGPSTTGGVAWAYLQSPDIISLAYGVQTKWDFTTATFVEDGSGVFTFDPAFPTELAYGLGSNVPQAVTIQGFALSTTNPATISPDNIYGFLSPPLPNPNGSVTPNGVYSRFIDDKTPIFGQRQVRYTLIEQIPSAAGGVSSTSLAFLNLDPGMANYSLRWAWLGATMVWGT